MYVYIYISDPCALIFLLSWFHIWSTEGSLVAGLHSCHPSSLYLERKCWGLWNKRLFFICFMGLEYVPLNFTLNVVSNVGEYSSPWTLRAMQKCEPQICMPSRLRLGTSRSNLHTITERLGCCTWATATSGDLMLTARARKKQNLVV